MKNYNKRISIQNPTTTDDGRGGRTETYTTTATVWAAVKQITNLERLQNMQLVNYAAYDIYTRYATELSLTEKSRVVWGTKNLSINRIENINEKDEHYYILATEKR